MPTVPLQKVVIVGQGYVGLPVAVRAVEVGYDVVGFDLDSERIARLNTGDSYVEDVTDESLRNALATGRYLASTDPADLDGYDIGVISVPTPLSEGVPDLRYIEQAAETLGRSLRRDACVILESTTYPGTTDELVARILEAASDLRAGEDFALGYSPERINPGDLENTFVNTPKVVSGIDRRSLHRIETFYRSLIEETVTVSSTRVAELTKLLENTFRHVNIALVNELAMFAHDLGIDAWEAIDAASTKPFGYMRFEPGPGVGGHCLPIDPSYLSWRVRRALGQTFRFVELANDVNDHMPDYVVRRLVTSMNQRGLAMKDLRVLLLGLAYKKNTSDARETPALQVVRLLLALNASVAVCDPLVQDDVLPPGVARVDLDDDAVAGADALVLLVDHDEFDLDVIGRARYVLDCRHRVAGENVEHL